MKFIDLFCGIGGFRIALEQLGGECVFSSDIDKSARETYKLNFGEEPYGDITTIEAKDIPDHNILCAGFPCQPFSIAGLRKGFEDTRGTLFFDVARIIKEKQPEAFILENVAGLVNHDSGRTLEVILKTLDDLGYHTSYKNMNAKKYGVPQNRDRWYCVGFRKDLGIGFNGDLPLNYEFPNERELEFTLNDIVQAKEMEDYKITPIAKRNIDKFLTGYIESEKYNQENVLIANEIRPSRANFSSTGISPCLTAKMGTGGNNVPVLVQYNRKLTEAECLRIMGYPEWYQIKPNHSQSYKQIGNSVVVPVISLLTEGMVQLLNEVMVPVEV